MRISGNQRTVWLLIGLLALPAAAAERDGAQIFAQTCAACHGSQGQGDGPGARDLDPRPRDLTARQIRFRSTPNGSAPTDEDLARTIRNGLPGSAMPGFGALLSDSELSRLVAFVQSLRPTESAEQPAPTPIELAEVHDPGPTTLSDGRALYLLVGCWRCHGLSGRGDGPSAKTLTDEDERSMRSTNFRRAPFKGGREAETLVRALRTGLNGTPMPSYDEAMMLSSADIGDKPSLEGMIDDEDAQRLDRFLAQSPPPETLAAMPRSERDALRDTRLAALAHYVISLERRSGAGYRLFVEQPELEGRKP
jgi:mono/diheme cytochrome c family protein